MKRHPSTPIESSIQGPSHIEHIVYFLIALTVLGIDNFLPNKLAYVLSLPLVPLSLIPFVFGRRKKKAKPKIKGRKEQTNKHADRSMLAKHGY
jgi:hypothetical protein